MTPPSFVNLDAFDTRLVRSCWRPVAIGLHRQRRPRQLALQHEVLAANFRRDGRLHGVEGVDDRHRLGMERGFSRLELHERQHGVDLSEELLFVPLNAAERLGLLRVERAVVAAAQQLGESRDRVERRAQLVTHDVHERGLGAVGSLRVAQGLVRLLQRPAPLGQRCAEQQARNRDDRDGRLQRHAGWCEGPRPRMDRGGSAVAITATVLRQNVDGDRTALPESQRRPDQDRQRQGRLMEWRGQKRNAGRIPEEGHETHRDDRGSQRRRFASALTALHARR